MMDPAGTTCGPLMPTSTRDGTNSIGSLALSQSTDLIDSLDPPAGHAELQKSNYLDLRLSIPMLPLTLAMLMSSLMVLPLLHPL
jgi:hypothetical protein